MFLHRAKIMTLAGLPIWIDASWLIFVALITWTLAAGVFPQVAPGLSAATYWWLGFAGAIGLFLSIILHELAHALVARHYDIPVSGITLFLFGGVAELHKEPHTARGEFMMAIVGPLVSLLIGFGLLAVGTTFSNVMSLPVAALVSYLGTINIVLAIFNMLPAFPLDGGRVLRSGLWAWLKDFNRATRIAATAGQVFGILIILYGILQFIGGNVIGGIWLFFIGLFLHGAAGASRHEVFARGSLEGKPVSAFMQRVPIAVDENISLRALVEQYFYKYFYKAFPVVRDGRLVGCIMASQMRDVPREYWDRLTVADVMQPCVPDIIVRPDLEALEALRMMQRTGHSRLLVVENGQLRGILALRDLLQYLSLKEELETAVEAPMRWRPPPARPTAPTAHQPSPPA